MKKQINITIENSLIKEKRDMNVYHHSTRSAHMICHNSSVTLPLRPLMEEDYLFITIVSGPGQLKNKSVVNLPSCIDFEFLTECKLAVIHSEDRTLLKIPPGLPEWKLKLTRSSIQVKQAFNRVVIGDDDLNY
ncbi:MAG: hypothetical protein GY940_09355 [bacterium]|nr:hypothetical protein [bacterium]